MDENVKQCIANLASADDKVRFTALQTLLGLTENKVDWVYDAWDSLFEKLGDENSYQRSIAILVLCNLAKSDTERRLEDSVDLLLAHTKDEKFITSRQCLQNICKVAVVSEPTRGKIIEHLEKRYRECSEEPHYNLLRQDIVQSIAWLAEAGKDDTLITQWRAIISAEKEEKYRKKYEAILAAK